MKDYRYGPYDKLIEQRVSQMTFSDEFKPFVIDGLKRRAFQYDFSEAQVLKDLDRLKNNLLRFTSKTDELTTVGVFYPSERRINLNPLTAAFQTNKLVYGDFLHELYHALSHEGINDQLAGTNRKTYGETFSLVEALVEGSSKATVSKMGPKDKVYHNNAEGYFTTGFAPEMLCATFGINKQELFANGIQDRSTLCEFLSKKVNVDYKQVEMFMDEFEMNMDNMHNALYGGDKEKRKIGIRGKVVEDAMGRMAYKCLTMMELINEVKKDEDYTPETFENMKFNYNKLLASVKSGSRYLAINPLNVGFSPKRVMQNFEKEAVYYKNGIIQTQYLLDFKKDHTIPPELSMFEIWARHGTLHRIYEPDRSPIISWKAKNIGLDVPKTDDIAKPFEISKEVIRRNNPPEEKLERWDNSFLRSHNIKNVIFMTAIKDKFEGVKKFFGIKPKQELLNSGQTGEENEFNLEEESKKPIDELALSPEEQKRIEQERMALINNQTNTPEEKQIIEDEEVK